VLLTAGRLDTNEIMHQAGTSRVTVWGRWQERFMRSGVAGLAKLDAWHLGQRRDGGEDARGPTVVLPVPFCNFPDPKEAESLDRPHRPHYHCAL
jgi:hypothetical protein